jgi:hypothetical protein
MRRFFIVAVVGLLSATAVPSHAATPTETDYIHCNPNGLTPNDSVNYLNDESRPIFTTDVPTKSLAGGACFFATAGTLYGTSQNTPYNLNATGGFVGSIDTITVRFYAAFAGQASRAGTPTLSAYLIIDDKSMFGLNAAGTLPARFQPKPVPTATEIPGLSQFEYSVTGLALLDDSAVHSVDIAVNISSELASVYPYDVVEAPASITFNPPAPAAYKIAATSPGPEE